VTLTHAIGYGTTGGTWVRRIVVLAIAILGSMGIALLAQVEPAFALLVAFGILGILAIFLAPKIAVGGLAAFLLFQSVLVNLAGGQQTALGLALQRLDEAMVVAAGLRVAALLRWRKLPVSLGGWTGLVGGFVVCGAISAGLSQVPAATWVLGAFLAVKFPVFLLLALTIKWGAPDAERVVRAVLILGPLFLLSGILLWVLPSSVSRIFLDPNSDFDEILSRGDLQSIHGLFIHPGLFGWAMAVVACFGIARLMTRPTVLSGIALLSGTMGIVASLRRKPLIALPLAAMVGMFAAGSKRQRLGIIVLLMVLIGGVIGVGKHRVRTVAQDTMMSYLDPYAPTTARALLYVTGWRVAEDHLPFGAGFGRFGGYVSQLHYSPLYDEYGLSSIYGLSRETPTYMQDTYWPHILAETGFLGTLILAAFFFRLWRRSVQVAKVSPNVHLRVIALAASMVLIEGLIESAVAPVFEISLLAYTIAIPLGITLVVGARRFEPPVVAEDLPAPSGRALG
jgi:hypothetical protein